MSMSIEVTSRLTPEDVAFALMKKENDTQAVGFILEVDACMQDLDFTNELIKKLVKSVYEDQGLEWYDEIMQQLKEISE